MTLPVFDPLPDESRFWVFAFPKRLTASDRQRIRQQLDAFLPMWVSHKVPVRGAYTILEDRFVLMAGHCPDGLSGCSMDSCVSNFKLLKMAHGLDGLNYGLVYYRNGNGEIESADRPTFQQKLGRGEVSPESAVFDTTLQTLSQLRAGGLELRLEKSWHARAFRVPVS